jgi:hypothetical protein
MYEQNPCAMPTRCVPCPRASRGHDCGNVHATGVRLKTCPREARGHATPASVQVYSNALVVRDMMLQDALSLFAAHDNQSAIDGLAIAHRFQFRQRESFGRLDRKEPAATKRVAMLVAKRSQRQVQCLTDGQPVDRSRVPRVEPQRAGSKRFRCRVGQRHMLGPAKDLDVERLDAVGILGIDPLVPGLRRRGRAPPDRAGDADRNRDEQHKGSTRRDVGSRAGRGETG